MKSVPPGTMVASQPIVPEPIPIRFPFPPFATNPDEAAPDIAFEEAGVERISRNLTALSGGDIEL